MANDDLESWNPWDPLTEHYNDKKSNTYNTGPGANLPSDLQPASYKKGENRFILWVSPLSARYTEASLKNLFSNYGEVEYTRIVNPKSGSPFGYVFYKTQSAANAAIRGFNDNANFDFKVSYAKNPEAIEQRNRSNRDRQDSNRDKYQNKNGHSSYQDKRNSDTNRDRSRSFKSTDASNTCDYNTDVTDDNMHNSRGQSFRDSIRSNSPNKDRIQTSQSFRGSIRSNSPPNQDRSIISFAFSQELFPSQKKAKPAEPRGSLTNSKMPEIEHEANGVAYVSPPQCSLCKKLTFMICSACHESFCNQECSIDGWRLHKGRRCIQVADLIRESSQTREPKTPEVARKPTPTKPQFANDASPGNEVSKFAHLAEDYLEYGRRQYNDSPAAVKFTPVLDNNYEDNVDGATAETKSFRKPEPYKRYENRESDSDRSRNTYGAESRGRRYDKENDNEKPRAYGDSRARKFDKDGTSDTEKSKTYSSDTSRDGHIGFKKNFDRRPTRDENERKPKSDGFETDTNYSKRSAQSRIDKRYSDVRATDDDNFTPQANSSAIADIDVTPYVSGRLRFKENYNCEVILISIVSPEQRLCYIKMAGEDDTINAMMKTLNEIKSFQTIDIVSKKKCVARHNGTWHRGFIESESPLKVKLIDCGIVVIVRPDDVRDIPSAFAQIPPFAHSVRLPSVSPDQLVSWKESAEVVSIKAIAVENKTWEVEPLNQPSFQERLEQARKERDRAHPSHESPKKQKPEDTPLPRTPPKKPEAAPVPSTSRGSEALLTAGVPTKVIVTFIQDKEVFFVADIQKFLKEFTKTTSIDFESLEPLTEINVGMLCVAFFSGICCRARVISTSPLKINYIDYGNVEPCEAKNIRVLPEECAKTAPLAVQVKLMSGTVEENNVAENDEVVITPIMKDTDTPAWIVCFGDKSAEFEELKKQNSAREETSSSVVDIAPPKKESKPSVVLDLFITYSVSKSEYYALRKADAGVFDSLNTKLSKTFEKADEVVKDEIYAMKFDELWCRAQVVDVKPLTVYFIDYGNTECCIADDLHRLPEDLRKEPPPLAFRVSLKNETHDLLEYGAWMNVLWDLNTDTYTLLRDPSAKKPNEEKAVMVGSGVVS